MSRYILRYLELKEKGFNKKRTIQKFINKKVYRAINVYDKKDGVWHILKPQKRKVL